MAIEALSFLIVLNAALAYAYPQSSHPTVAGNNITNPVTLKNTNSVFPIPSHPPNTSSAEFRIYLGFLVFGAVAGAALLLYPIVVFALDRRGRKRASTALTDPQSGLTISEEEIQGRVRRPQPAVLH